MAPPHASFDPDELESLVAECLERLATEGERALELLCREHPHHARALRRQVEAADAMGLIPRAEEPALPERLGPFRVVGRLGGGGMGVVLRAEQDDLQRTVALKLIRADQLHSPDTRARFRREAEAVARLQHPGIVPVHMVGEEDGVPYIAMELVSGASLDQIVRELSGAAPGTLGFDDFAAAFARASNDETLDAAAVRAASAGHRGAPWTELVLHLVRQVADALDHAHTRGVLHRDVKPSNVMVTASGRAILFDFGLARPTDAPRMTRTGQEVGSLAYMSPEQIEGAADVDQRADVYALGVTLYEMLTLRRPFSGRTGEEVRRLILEGRPAPPRRLNTAVTWEVETVCLTAMDPDPARRYATAADFARDLANLLGDRLIEARRPGPLLRFRRLLRRRPAAALGLLLAVVVFVIAPGAWTWQREVSLDRIRGERDRADREAMEKAAALRDVTRLSDGKILGELVERERTLWPARPERVDALRDWLDEADELLSRLPVHHRQLEMLRSRGSPAEDHTSARDRRRLLADAELAARNVDDLEDAIESGIDPALEREAKAMRANLEGLITGLEARAEAAPEVVMDSVRDRWELAVLTELVGDLEAFGGEGGLVSRVRRRLEYAAGVRERSVTSWRERWERSSAAVAAAPRYGGLVLEPQLDLIPLGADPRSGLQEFLHLQTHRGELPRRDAAGRLAIGDDTGIVFVLVPAGTFHMGAQSEDPSAPCHDPDATDFEGPVQRVELAAFFLSKYEVTQGQWQRASGTNPSYYSPSRVIPHAPRQTLAHPVEKVSWEECDEILRRLGLTLPTEARWEYAARAGTSDPWWTGRERASLAGCANLADRAARAAGATWPALRDWPELDDGWPTHAPVAAVRPNPWGFHGIHGNVAEWCLDRAVRYAFAPARAGDGARPNLIATSRAIRGGDFSGTAVLGRCAARNKAAADYASDYLGVRPAREIEDAPVDAGR